MAGNCGEHARQPGDDVHAGCSQEPMQDFGGDHADIGEQQTKKRRRQHNGGFQRPSPA
jgi:hypothetical protein